jgi:IclR family pca regulon transcriptional regulator
MTVGTRFPAHASSTGKLLLGAMGDEEFGKLYEGISNLPEVTPFTVRNVGTLREQATAAYQKGWNMVDQETAIGMASVAVPLNVKGRVRYGLSTSATLKHEGADFVELYLPELKQAAESMQKLLDARL